MDYLVYFGKESIFTTIGKSLILPWSEIKFDTV